MLFAFGAGSIYLLAPDYYHMWILDKISVYLILTYILIIHFQSIPKKQVLKRVRWFIPVIWVLACILFNIYLKWIPDCPIGEICAIWGQDVPKSNAFRKGLLIGWAEILFKPGILFLMYYRTYYVEKFLNFISDQVEDDHIYICLWRPQTTLSIIQSLFGLCIGGVSIYVRGGLYGYVWKRERYSKRSVSPEVLEKKYIIIDTKIKTRESHLACLDDLIGTSAGLRCRCIYTIRHFLSELDEELKPNFTEMMPSRYSYKVVKWRLKR